MRLQVSAGAMLRVLAVVALVGAAAASSGCGASVALQVTSARNLNSPNKAGHRLAYRVVQFKDVPSLAGAQFPSVWKHEGELPGAVGVPEDGTFAPDTTVTLRIKAAKGAKAFAIIGNYYKPQGDCWYYVRSFKERTRPAVTAGASCFAPTPAR